MYLVSRVSLYTLQYDTQKWDSFSYTIHICMQIRRTCLKIQLINLNSQSLSRHQQAKNTREINYKMMANTHTHRLRGGYGMGTCVRVYFLYKDVNLKFSRNKCKWLYYKPHDMPRQSSGAKAQQTGIQRHCEPFI